MVTTEPIETYTRTAYGRHHKPSVEPSFRFKSKDSNHKLKQVTHTTGTGSGHQVNVEKHILNVMLGVNSSDGASPIIEKLLEDRLLHNSLFSINFNQLGEDVNILNGVEEVEAQLGCCFADSRDAWLRVYILLVEEAEGIGVLDCEGVWELRGWHLTKRDQAADFVSLWLEEAHPQGTMAVDRKEDIGLVGLLEHHDSRLLGGLRSEGLGKILPEGGEGVHLDVDQGGG